MSKQIYLFLSCAIKCALLLLINSNSTIMASLYGPLRKERHAEKCHLPMRDEHSIIIAFAEFEAAMHAFRNNYITRTINTNEFYMDNLVWMNPCYKSGIFFVCIQHKKRCELIVPHLFGCSWPGELNLDHRKVS